jgi:hypothetical protein
MQYCKTSHAILEVLMVSSSATDIGLIVFVSAYCYLMAWQGKFDMKEVVKLTGHIGSTEECSTFYLLTPPLMQYCTASHAILQVLMSSIQPCASLSLGDTANSRKVYQ